MQQVGEENQRYSGRKGGNKTLADNMIMAIKNAKQATKQPLELISEFCEVTKYKVNIQKSIIFLWVRANHLKFKLEKAMHLENIRNC